MTTIKDVAAEAGVSIATVSRVLRDKPHVSDGLRQRVLAAVEELGYRPNLVARNLRARESTTLGLIVSDIRNPFFTDISRAVEDLAHEKGYSVFFCNSDENPEKERIYLNLMHDENVAGVIFSPTRRTAANFSAQDVQYPVVVVDRALGNGEVDMVLIDNEEAGYRLANHLIGNGYRRLAGIFGEASTTGRARRRGFRAALREHQLTPVADGLTAPRIEAGYAAVRTLLEAKEPPDAILATNSLLTAGALKAIKASNRAIPDEVALAGFDETTWSTLVTPPLTVIAQPTYDIGRTATDLLLQRIDNPERPARTTILKGKLITRASTAPRE
jgi:LacI family fructose operon transcriptional repressor